jgi:hypothetical protein
VTSRYDPFDPDELRETTSPTEDSRERKPEEGSPSIGRAGSGREDPNDSRSGGRRKPVSGQRHRQKYRDRDRTYELRESELQILTDVGKFRIVRTRDLVELRYSGDAARAERDITNLKSQGLLQQRTLHGTKNEPLLALSHEAQQFLDRNRPEGSHSEQIFYRGFVKPREARHDAEVYRLYERAAEDIEQVGGTNVRVVLDFELKRNLYRDLVRLKNLPPEHQEEERERIAQSHGLTVVDGKIPLPDLRIEYETRDHQQERADFELATQDYRAAGLADKAKAGFTIYAPRDEAARLRTAIRDPELTRGILSL